MACPTDSLIPTKCSCFSDDNLRDKKVIKDVTMSKLNNESYLGLQMAMALGSRYLVGKDCHWIGVTWMTREA
jgi:hypothetical protein